MTNQFFITFIIILLSFCFSSCQDDDNTDEYYFNTNSNPYDCINSSNEFFNDGNNIFSYTCNGDWIEFSFDIIADESNEVDGFWPNIDLYRIYIDIENNGILDERKDIMLAKSNSDEICKFFLLSQTSTSPCFSVQDIVEESKFSETENSSTEHYNVKITLPKYHLSYSSTANLVIEIYDRETGWQRFPSNQELFSDTFEIKL